MCSWNSQQFISLLKVIISSVLCACDLISLTWYFTNDLLGVNYYMYSIIPTIYIQFSFQTNDCLIAHAERNLYFNKSLDVVSYAAFSFHNAFLVFLGESLILTFLSETGDCSACFYLRQLKQACLWRIFVWNVDHFRVFPTFQTKKQIWKQKSKSRKFVIFVKKKHAGTLMDHWFHHCCQVPRNKYRLYAGGIWCRKL